MIFLGLSYIYLTLTICEMVISIYFLMSLMENEMFWNTRYACAVYAKKKTKTFLPIEKPNCLLYSPTRFLFLMTTDHSDPSKSRTIIILSSVYLNICKFISFVIVEKKLDYYLFHLRVINFLLFSLVIVIVVPLNTFIVSSYSFYL